VRGISLQEILRIWVIEIPETQGVGGEIKVLTRSISGGVTLLISIKEIQ
jgi:hypothetical protein